MTSPVQITFRHMDPSPAVDARIREEAAALNHSFARITSCHVIVDAPHHHHEPGARTFHIGIEIGVPGSRIEVNHEPSLHAALAHGETGTLGKHLEVQPDHKDIYVCIRDAFRRARRQLEDYARILRGDIKHHAGETPSP